MKLILTLRKQITACLATVLFLASHSAMAQPELPTVKVYKNPSCGCCKKWINHLEKNGFKVEASNVSNLDPIKQKFGIAPQFRACHTAKIGKYVVEGHVPASDIKKMLAEKPDIMGLAVPGMPMGSPGMEGHRKDPYQVISLKQEGQPEIYSRH